MFSMEEKKQIAQKIEELLLGFNHPEMPKERPLFTLQVIGKEPWSWAEISPNWTFSEHNPPQVNPWNEHAREAMKGRQS